MRALLSGDGPEPEVIGLVLGDPEFSLLARRAVGPPLLDLWGEGADAATWQLVTDGLRARGILDPEAFVRERPEPVPAAMRLLRALPEADRALSLVVDAGGGGAVALSCLVAGADVVEHWPTEDGLRALQLADRAELRSRILELAGIDEDAPEAGRGGEHDLDFATIAKVFTGQGSGALASAAADARRVLTLTLARRDADGAVQASEVSWIDGGSSERLRVDPHDGGAVFSALDPLDVLGLVDVGLGDGTRDPDRGEAAVAVPTPHG